jgi:hypothetical protein
VAGRLIGGNPGVKIVYYDDNELPEPEEKTHWEPVIFLAGRKVRQNILQTGF